MGGGLVNLFAPSIDDGVTFVAHLADSFLSIELLASALHLAAHSVLVKVVPVGALQAGVLRPHRAPEVVVQLQ